MQGKPDRINRLKDGIRKRRLCLSFFILPHFHWWVFNFQFFRVCLPLLGRECIFLEGPMTDKVNVVTASGAVPCSGYVGGGDSSDESRKYLSQCTGFASATNRAFLQKTTAKSGLLIRAGVPPYPRGLKNYVYLRAGGILLNTDTEACSEWSQLQTA